MANSRSARAPRTAPVKTVHKIKITLRESRPPVWRRLEVPSGITLRELHDVIQAAFGWEDYHIWAFESGRDRYSVADRDLGIGSAASTRLGQVAPHTGDRLHYTYDFGDDWEHDILIEDVTAPEAATLDASPAAEPARPRIAAASGDTTTSSRSSPTPATKNTKTAWNGWASTLPTSATPQRSTQPRSTPRYPLSRPCSSSTDASPPDVGSPRRR
ncbi:plasmid pRiA4b ORF-3 family protein [Streptomyces sp. CA-142005]|uniref:plasmid pRiA4b ORF-3 family protein n=1 Tax=Streptomyces sp. CA-142005 TaxID=3240052 RepID=UPI003D91CAF8